MDPPRGNGWDRWENLVLAELKELKDGQTRLEDGQVLLRIDVAKLKVKAGLWGGIAGLVPGMVGIAVLLLSGGSAGA